MSKILDGLKEAEQKRERVIAERKRLEAEADAALAERERGDRLRHAQAEIAAPQAGVEPPPAAPEPRAPQARTPEQHSRVAAGVAIAVALAVVFWVGTLVPQHPAPTMAPPAPPARMPLPMFRFDRDDAAFAARVREGARE